MFPSRWWLSWGWRRSHPGCEWISPPLSPKFSAKLSQHNQFRDRFICQQLKKCELRLKRIFSWKILPSIDHLCRLIFEFLTNNIKSRVLPETCSLYQISSGKGGQWSFYQDLLRSFYSMWNLGEQNKGVDAGAVGLVHWDRNVQEAVSPPHLDKTWSRNEILKLLAGDCLHAPTWMFLHLDTLHLFLPPTWMFCRLSLLSSLLSRFASWSQKSPELLYKNIARIANAVQVTLWLSVNHLNRCLFSHFSHCSQCLLVSTSVY